MESGGSVNQSQEQGGAIANTNTSTNVPKRSGHRHTPQQIRRLEAFFKECPNPSDNDKRELGRELGLEPHQIKFWFQNKRTQSKAQLERNDNALLRVENEKILCENHAIQDALINVICPTCGGPPFGQDERLRSLETLRVRNLFLREQLQKVTGVFRQVAGSLFPRRIAQPPYFMQYGASSMSSFQVSSSEEGADSNYTSFQTAAVPVPVDLTPPLSELEKMIMGETATMAMQELMHVWHNNEQLWTPSCTDNGRLIIDQSRYELFFKRNSKVSSLNARVESSRETALVPIEASDLVRRLLDSSTLMELFPTIINKAKTIYVLEPGFPNQGRSLQLMYEQMHILSPLVPPREFVVLRSCEQISPGLWLLADVSFSLKDFTLISSVSCWKRPSGCLIHYVSDSLCEVTWIEHVEVDDKAHTHRLYRDILCSGSGYGARRWLVTLVRMLQRLTWSHLFPATSTGFRGSILASAEGRKNVMKLGQRMVKNLSETMTMSGKLDFPKLSDAYNSGVRISVRRNVDASQPAGTIVTAASSVWIRLAPPLVYSFFRDIQIRHQWDVLCHGNPIAEVGRIFGGDENHSMSILQPFIPTEAGIETGMVVLQESFLDSLGGMVVYAPVDIQTLYMNSHTSIPILPSGFIISGDSRPPTAASSSHGSASESSLLTVAFQILISGPNDISNDVDMESVFSVNTLITSTIQRLQELLNPPI